MIKKLMLLALCFFVLIVTASCSSLKPAEKEQELTPNVNTSADISKADSGTPTTLDTNTIESEDAIKGADSGDKKDNPVSPNNSSIPEYIGSHKVLEYTATDDKFYIKLDGTYEGMIGQLSYDEHYYGSFVLDIASSPNMASHEFSLHEFNSSINPPSDTYCLDDNYVIDKIGQEFADYIKSGNSMIVECNITDYEFGANYASEPFTGGTVDIYSFVTPEIAPSKPQVYLSNLQNETLYSQDTPFDINYEDYSLVIIPMQDSVNMDKLKPRTVDVTETELTTEYMQYFSVFGTLHNVTLTYTQNANDPDELPLEIFVDDTIENECVFVNALMPTDFSYVTITGSYQVGSGLEEISFALDSMRDPESYKIMTVDAYSYPDEEY